MAEKKYMSARLESICNQMRAINDFFATATEKLIFQAKAHHIKVQPLSQTFEGVQEKALKFNAGASADERVDLSKAFHEIDQLILAVIAKYLYMEANYNKALSKTTTCTGSRSASLNLPALNIFWQCE